MQFILFYLMEVPSVVIAKSSCTDFRSYFKLKTQNQIMQCKTIAIRIRAIRRVPNPSMRSIQFWRNGFWPYAEAIDDV